MRNIFVLKIFIILSVVFLFLGTSIAQPGKLSALVALHSENVQTETPELLVKECAHHLADLLGEKMRIVEAHEVGSDANAPPGVGLPDFSAEWGIIYHLAGGKGRQSKAVIMACVKELPVKKSDS